MDIYTEKSGYFDSLQNIETGREIYYYVGRLECLRIKNEQGNPLRIVQKEWPRKGIDKEIVKIQIG